MRFILAVVLVAAVIRVLVSALEPKLVFFPTRGQDQTPASLGIPYHVVHLETSDGETLVAWQFEPERPLADVVYFHGNGGNLSVWLPILAGLHKMSLRVLAVDYRGYGLSTGTPSEEGLYRDAAAVAQHVARTRTASPTRPLVFWGRSLGGAVAASATSVLAPDGLVLESSFADKAAVARTHPVFRILNAFAAYRFETAEMLKGFRNPVLVMHGDRDSIVPYEVGRELYERLSGPKQFVTIAWADHNDLVDISHSDYWTPVVEFVSRLRPLAHP